MTLNEKIKYAPFYLLSLIPLKILYLVSNGLYLIIYKCIGYRKSVVRSNLQLAFPQHDKRHLLEIEKKFYQHFCDSFVESLKAISIGKQHLLNRIKIINPEILEQYESKNKSYILYSGHFGNWEWMLSFPLLLKPKIVTFYLPLRNLYFSNLIKGIRGRFGVESIEAGRGYKALLQYSVKKISTFTLFLADQSPHRDANMHWTLFFNNETSFNTGITAMSKKLKPVVLFPHYRKISRGYYEVEFVELWNGEGELKEHEIINRFAVTLEKAIIESPHLWLWTHRRWKLKKSDYQNENVSILS